MQLFNFKNIYLFLYTLIIVLTLNTTQSKAQSTPLPHIKNKINVPIKYVKIPHYSLLLTQKRVYSVQRKIITDSTAWNELTDKLSHYFDKTPYNSGEYAGAFALAYYISGNEKYINRAITLLRHTYFNEPDIGWKYYKNRNFFRTDARWAMMGYTWIKNKLPKNEQLKIENIFKLWSEYWLKHVDIDNNYKALRIADTDDITSITKNLMLLGYVLSESHQHKTLGEKNLIAADHILEHVVVNYYMKGIMQGGAWAEGSDYSPSTQAHWIETFIINKDQRNIDYPETYAKQAMQSLLHQTLANNKGVYKYGSEEKAIDYDPLEDDYRYELAMNLMAILEEDNDLALINNWFNKIIDTQGFKKGSMVTNFSRLLFHDPHYYTPHTPKLDTMHYAKGVGLISSRSSWNENATNLFFINRKIRVDHEHKDALSFDIAHKGHWITKEATGYGKYAESGSAHNTILIENGDDGSSSPHRRPVDDPFYHTLFDNNDVTLISADATQAYNMTGYYSTNYAKLVNRQLAFLKPSTVIIYDHVLTDPTQIKDLITYNNLNLSAGMTHNRWVKIIQHVQTKPRIMPNHHNVFQVTDSNTSLVYQVIEPKDATVDIIEEKLLWNEAPEYSIPKNQKKWHFNVSNPKPKKNNEFITSLNFSLASNNSIEELILAPLHMTKENGYIISGNAIGLAFEAYQKKYIILFNKSPNAEHHTVQIKKPSGYSNALIHGINLNVIH